MRSDDEHANIASRTNTLSLALSADLTNLPSLPTTSRTLPGGSVTRGLPPAHLNDTTDCWYEPVLCLAISPEPYRVGLCHEAIRTASSRCSNPTKPHRSSNDLCGYLFGQRSSFNRYRARGVFQARRGYIATPGSTAAVPVGHISQRVFDPVCFSVHLQPETLWFQSELCRPLRCCMGETCTGITGHW